LLRVSLQRIQALLLLPEAGGDSGDTGGAGSKGIDKPGAEADAAAWTSAVSKPSSGDGAPVCDRLRVRGD
jgi:hypothetical protein